MSIICALYIINSILRKEIQMKFVSNQIKKVLKSLVILTSFTAFSVLANGEMGDHVNHLSEEY